MTWARIFNGFVAHSVLETVGKPMLFDFSKMLGKQNGAGWYSMTSSLCVLSLAWAQQPSGCATAEYSFPSSPQTHRELEELADTECR